MARGELRRLAEQPLRDGRGARWVGFQLDVADGDPVPHLVAVFRLDGADGRLPAARRRPAGRAPPGVSRRLLDGATRRAWSGADGRLPLRSRCGAAAAWLATLEPEA